MLNELANLAGVKMSVQCQGNVAKKTANLNRTGMNMPFVKSVGLILI